MRGKKKRRSVGRPTRHSTPDAREQLLDAAATLFAEKGVAGTRVTEVAAAANVTAAMIHYYFRKRDQLIDAVVSERMGPIITQIWDPVSEASDPELLLLGLAGRVMQGAERYPWFAPLWLREVVADGGILRARLLKRFPTDRVNHLMRSVRAAQSTSRLSRELDPRLMVATILGLTLLPMATLPILQEVPIVHGVDARAIARHANAVLRCIVHQCAVRRRKAAV